MTEERAFQRLTNMFLPYDEEMEEAELMLAKGERGKGLRLRMANWGWMGYEDGEFDD